MTLMVVCSHLRFWIHFADKRLLGFFGALTWLAALSALAAAGRANATFSGGV
jgi:hypothetical protein